MQNVKTIARLASEPVKKRIASRVLNDKAELLSGALAGEILELLEARGVLIFPEIGFTEAEQIAFTQTLGTPAPEGSDGRVTAKVSLDARENPEAAEFLKGSLYWHIDGTNSDVPIHASLLTCKVPAPQGGNTGFCNTYAAWDDLPQEEKAAYDGRRVVHAPWASLAYYDPEPRLQTLRAMQALGEKELPLVWKHESGRKSLILGCTARNVVGLEHKESAALLAGLREWATSPAFSYSHAWRAGDLVMWDNTGTMHRAEAYDPMCGRLMMRTKLEGQEAFA
ncbi:TauD/TfdA family dioxygenase [Sphingomonas sp. TF3]|uniref:TauD/TfdA dioxygenase family protein n=1 Tax=Sphingomonas sp. TF3 TaxID=2495580 RepID=UPI000F87E955|nr:TauD/TfdA family dioxygenase [Sphingomonas sp. TF3]RUN78332.1 TauD/TfdA family dioxygenase [Sphingomonas sp. TF3]